MESLVKTAAQIEKNKLLQMRDHARANQLSGIVTNKMDKLLGCYASRRRRCCCGRTNS